MKRNWGKIRRFIPMYLMLLPGLVYLFINNYMPMAGIIIAFKKYNYSLGILKSPFTGLKNFEFLFKTKDAWTITRNTLGYNVIFIVVGTVLAIAVAILLNEIRSTMGKKIYQTLILVPFLISIVVVSYLVYGFLSTDAGFINNSILKPMGKQGIGWYSDPKYWPFILIFVNVWKNLGYNCIIYYATVVGLDASLYESASIDGANRWKQTLNVTIPGIENNHYHLDADECRTYFLFRFRTVLSGTNEQRTADRRDKHHRYLRISWIDGAEQHRYGICSRSLSVTGRICTGTDCKPDCSKTGRKQCIILSEGRV